MRVTMLDQKHHAGNGNGHIKKESQRTEAGKGIAISWWFIRHILKSDWSGMNGLSEVWIC